MITALNLKSPPLTVWRCPSCGNVLARLDLKPGSVVEVKCRHCKTIVVKQVA